MLRPLSSTTGVFKINAHIPLLLFVLLPPIPNYNVDDFVLRGAGRRRVSDYFAAACTQHFHVQLCEGGKGGGLQHIWRPEHVRLFWRHRYCLWSNVLACGSGKAGAREREERCREGVRQVWQGRQRSEGAQPSRKSFLGYWRHICSSCDIIQVAQASTSNIPANILKPMTSVISYSPWPAKGRLYIVL